jgi:signal transduction histidine kinase
MSKQKNALPKPSRLTFRARLTWITAGTFILLAAALLLTQQLVLSHLVETQFLFRIEVSSGYDGSMPEINGTVQTPDSEPQISVGPAGTQVETDDTIEMGENRIKVTPEFPEIVQASQALVDSVNRWSLGLFCGFAVLCVVAAWFVSGQALGRVRQLTAFVNGLSSNNLDAKIDLRGPRDEVTELAGTFDRLLERLHLAFTAQRRFVSNASHELRTPLTTNRMAIQLALASDTLTEANRIQLTKALDANRRSEELLSSLLTLALNAEPDAPSAQVAELDSLVADSVEQVAEQLTSKQIQVETSLEPVSVQANPDLARTAVENLIGNAVKYSPAGSAVAVGLSSVVSDDQAVLTVTNPLATSISEADLGLLTEPFFRTDQAKLNPETPGLGLGLSLVESIAHRSGGTLSIKADEHHFTAELALPLYYQ